MSAVKNKITEIVREMPEDSSYDDILRQLAMERMIERGLEDSKNEKAISNEEMLHRIQTW